MRTNPEAGGRRPEAGGRRRAPGAGRWALGGRLFVVAVALVGATACRQDMQDQPKYEPLEASRFFEDGRASRPVVEDTVARGQLRLDPLRDAGRIGNELADRFPAPVSRAMLDRGEERYEIYCTPCHGRAGDGQGIVAQRGFKRQPATFHTDRLRQAAPGHFFDVITNGFGAMLDYRSQIAVDDRWAIVAYVRVLQLSQHAAVDDVPEAERGTLDAPRAAEATGGESHR